MTPHPGRTYLERDSRHSHHAWVGVSAAVIVLAALLSTAAAHLAGYL